MFKSRRELARDGVEENPGPRNPRRGVSTARARNDAASPALADLRRELKGRPRDCPPSPSEDPGAATSTTTAAELESRLRAAEMRLQARIEKGHKLTDAKHKEKTLEAEVRREAEQKRGERDAAKEIAQDARMAEAVAKYMHEMDGLGTYTAELESWIRGPDGAFMEFYIRAVAPDKEGSWYLSDYFKIPGTQFTYDCALAAADLSPCYAPHTLLHVVVQDIRYTLPPRPGEFVQPNPDMRLPQLRDTPHTSTSMTVVCEVSGVEFGAGYHRLGLSHERWRPQFQIEDLALCGHHRYGESGQFSATLTHVQSYRSTVNRINQYQNKQSVSLVSDLVFTSLLLLNARATQRSFTAPEATAHLATRAVLQELGRDMPLAGGTYVQGYQYGLDQVVPAEILDRYHEFVEAGSGWVERRYDSTRHSLRAARARWRHCVQAPIAFENLLPAFPEPRDIRNVKAGVFKRLFTRFNRVTPRQALLYREAIRGIMDRAVPAPLERGVIWDALMNGMHSEWSVEERTDYASGAISGLVACGQIKMADGFASFFRGRGWPAVVIPPGDWKNLVQLSWHAKAETYNPAEMKAVRGVVAPSHFFRGLCCALLSPAQEAFFTAMGDHCVKHRSAAAVTMEMLRDFPEGMVTVETDYKSFEAQQRLMHIEGEMGVFLAYTPPELERGVRVLREILTMDQDMVLPDLKIVTPCMRISGMFHTSWGNFVNNLALCTALMSHLAEDVGYMGIDAAKAAYQGLGAIPGLVYKFEGDDGAIGVPDDLVQTIAAHQDPAAAGSSSAPAVKPVSGRFNLAATALGVTLKFEEHWTAAEAHFCGNTLARCKDMVLGGYHRMKDVLDILARATSLFEVDPNTQAGRAELQFAKCYSYYRDFGSMPVIGPCLYECMCRLDDEGVADNAREQVEQYLAAVKSGVQFKKTPLALWIEDQIGAIGHRGRADPTRDLDAALWFLGEKTSRLCVPDPVPVDSLLREAVGKFTHSAGRLGACAQEAIEAAVHEVVFQARMHVPASFPLLTDQLLEGASATARMVGVQVVDAREFARQHCPTSDDVFRLFQGLPTVLTRVGHGCVFVYEATIAAALFFGFILGPWFFGPLLAALSIAAGLCCVAAVGFAVAFAVTGKFLVSLKWAMRFLIFFCAVMCLHFWVVFFSQTGLINGLISIARFLRAACLWLWRRVMTSPNLLMQLGRNLRMSYRLVNYLRGVGHPWGVTRFVNLFAEQDAPPPPPGGVEAEF